jgi:hypothetical protein
MGFISGVYLMVEVDSRPLPAMMVEPNGGKISPLMGTTSVLAVPSARWLAERHLLLVEGEGPVVARRSLTSEASVVADPLCLMKMALTVAVKPLKETLD